MGMSRPRSLHPRSKIVNFRLTAAEYSRMESDAAQRGFDSLSDYLRHLHSTAEAKRKPLGAVREDAYLYDVLEPRVFQETSHGRIYHGNSLGLLHKSLEPESVDLIVTSPPFGLVRKKDYGNEDAGHYVEWFRPFAKGMAPGAEETGKPCY